MKKLCKYCVPFYRSTVRKDRSPHYKICKDTGAEINSTSEACKRFQLHDTFFCDINQHWVTIEMCLNRQRTNPDWARNINCRKCLQFSREVTSHYPCDRRRLQIKNN